MLTTYRSYEDAIITLDFAPDSRSVLAAYRNNTVALWDVESGEILRQLEAVSGATYAPNGEWVATGGGGGIMLWDAASFEALGQVGTEANQRVLAFSPDSRMLASANGQEIILYELAGSSRIGTFTGYSGTINDLEFSSNGKWLFSVGSDGIGRLWELATGQEIRQYVGHGIQVWQGRISSDMRYLLTAGQDGTGRLWDLATGAELRRFRAEGGFQAASFSPAGTMVLFGSTTGRLYLNPSFISDSITLVCSRLLRDLAASEAEQYELEPNRETCSD